MLLVMFVLSASACERSRDAASEDPRLSMTPEMSMVQFALGEAQQRQFEGADIELGALVVIGAAPCQASANCFPCYPCHGIRGEGSALANFPRLTGQSYAYLYQSLRDFKSERRANPTMQAVANGLTDLEMKNVAAYYAAMAPGWPASNVQAADTREVDPDVLMLGHAIAASGVPEAGIQPCESCHGIEGPPLMPAYPYLSGQDPEYLEDQLRAFRAGTRNDSLNIMQFIAKQLSEQQMHAAARFYGSLAPPGASSVQPDTVALTDTASQSP